jgi:hypothetical protein
MIHVIDVRFITAPAQSDQANHIAIRSFTDESHADR